MTAWDLRQVPDDDGIAIDVSRLTPERVAEILVEPPEFTARLRAFCPDWHCRA